MTVQDDFVERQDPSPPTLPARLHEDDEHVNDRKVQKTSAVPLTTLRVTIPHNFTLDLNKRYQKISSDLESNFIKQLLENAQEHFQAINLILQTKKLNQTTCMFLNFFLQCVVESPNHCEDVSVPLYNQYINTFHLLIDDCNEKLQTAPIHEKIIFKTILIHLRKIAYISLTATNARKVHFSVLKFLKIFDFPTYPTADLMMNHLDQSLPLDHLRELAQTWDKASQLIGKGSIQSNAQWNIPNQTFQLIFPCNEKITFFRFASPEVKPEGGTPLSIYRSMLEVHEKNDSRHMDVSLLRLEEWESEISRSILRYQLYKNYPGTLITWAFDYYSDFSWQDNPFKISNSRKICSFSILKQNLTKALFNEDRPSFLFPIMGNQEKAFEAKVEEIINIVHEDFFSGAKYFCQKKTTAFTDLTVLQIFEYLCEQYTPQTIDTACRSHIDRGMSFMTLLYYYLLVKNGKEENLEYLTYMEEMIFAPSFLNEQRPTHLDVMARLLHTLSIMHDNEVRERIRSRQSFFSNAEISIPMIRD